MGNEYTTEQKQVYGEYQKAMRTVVTEPAQLESLIGPLCSDLAQNKRDVGTFIGGFIKYQLKSTSETDQAKYYYLLMLKIFVDTGNKELVVDFLPKNLMKRLGMIALHRKQEKEMDRGTDCIRQYSAMNDPSVGRNSATAPQWEYNFFHLLLEMIRYWGSPGTVGKNALMPKEYGLLFNSLINQQVTFPAQNKYLNSSPTTPGQPTLNRSSPQLDNSQRSASAPIEYDQNYGELKMTLEEVVQMREGFVRMAMKEPFDPNIGMIHELYTNLASELRSNSNVPLLETDTSSQGKSMLERVKCEDRLEQQISSTWRKMEQGGGPESMQQGVVDAYKKEMSLDLLTDPGLSPSLLQNIKPQRIQQSARHEIPAPVPAMKPVTIHQTPSSQVSQPKPAVADPPKQMQPSPLQRRPALPFHPELDSGHNSGFQDDYVAPNQVRPEPPISMPKPRPKVSVTPAQQPSERPMKDRTPGFGFQALAIPSQETTISSGDSQLKPPSRATKPISREETTRPTAPPQQPTTSRGMLNTGLGRTDNYNLNPSAFGQKSGDQSSSNKPTTQPWEYNKSALTYSQVLKKAPTESALFNTPGLYETERKKLRDNLMLKREMEFQQQLEVARMQSRGNNDSHRKSDFRVNPSQIYYGQYVADVSYNPHQEYLINLSERAHQSNDEVRKYQVQLKMLQNSVTTSEKAANLFEKQVDRQTTQATDLNTRAEILATEVSSLAQQKEDLILKLERKRAELMEQKRRAHATSDSDQYRKRDLQEENASLRRLISYKASEKSRLKSKYDQLEQEYSQHSALKTADFASPNKVLDRVLSRSAMVDWAPWRERFEDIPGTKSRKAHADMGSTMAGAESRGFLSELNRSVDKLLMNRPEQESRFI